MKTIAYLSWITLFSSLLLTLSCSQSTSFTLLDGKSHSQADFEGKWVLINFWAEWCAPCLEEIPELNLLAAEKDLLNLEVIGISFDPLTNGQLRNSIKKWSIQYPIMATEPVPILSFELPPALPANYLINPQGQVVLKLAGKQTATSLKQAIAQQKLVYKGQ